jgi:uncharacterized protein (UPF0335 family)
MNTPQPTTAPVEICQEAKAAGFDCDVLIRKDEYQGTRSYEISLIVHRHMLAYAQRKVEESRAGWVASFSGKDADLQEAKRSIALLKEYHDIANRDRSNNLEKIESLEAQLATLTPSAREVLLRRALQELVRQYDEEHGMGDISAAKTALDPSQDLSAFEVVRKDRIAALELAQDVIANLSKLVTNDDGIDPEAHHIELTAEEANLIRSVSESARRATQEGDRKP